MSEQLERLLKALQDGNPHTRQELSEACDISFPSIPMKIKRLETHWIISRIYTQSPGFSFVRYRLEGRRIG